MFNIIIYQIIFNFLECTCQPSFHNYIHQSFLHINKTNILATNIHITIYFSYILLILNLILSFNNIPIIYFFLFLFMFMFMFMFILMFILLQDFFQVDFRLKNFKNTVCIPYLYGYPPKAFIFSLFK